MVSRLLETRNRIYNLTSIYILGLYYLVFSILDLLEMRDLQIPTKPTEKIRKKDVAKVTLTNSFFEAFRFCHVRHVS